MVPANSRRKAARPRFGSLRPASLWLLVGALLLAGCVIIPLPMGEGDVTEGREVALPENEVPGLLGRSRAEVVERLGEPGALWEERRILLYAWDRVHLKLLWFVAGGYRAAGGIADVPTHYLLLIQLDDAGTVTRAERCTRPMTSAFGDFVKGWADGKPCS